MVSEDEHRGERGNAFVQFYRWVFGIGYERNVGGLERTVRYTAGALSVLAGIGVIVFPVVETTLGNAIIGVVLLVTGLYLIYEARVQYCPLNDTLDRSTDDGA